MSIFTMHQKLYPTIYRLMMKTLTSNLKWGRGQRILTVLQGAPETPPALGGPFTEQAGHDVPSISACVSATEPDLCLVQHLHHQVSLPRMLFDTLLLIIQVSIQNASEVSLSLITYILKYSVLFLTTLFVRSLFVTLFVGL